MSHEFIPPHGNYKDLLSYREAEIVYDLTYDFCHRFLARTDRTIDQIVQAARSGKQTIVEASTVSGTSKEAELKLIGCARGSLRELLNDYHDVLRVRSAPAWPKDCREARYVRRLGSDPDVTYEAYRDFCETRPIEVVANVAICLIHQTSYLLDQQLRQLQRDFVKDGGLRERMFRARRESRDP
jgi:four helix bundle suffix protein